MSKGTTSQDAPFGTLLGYAPGGVAIYSSDYSSLDPRDYDDDAAFRSYIDDEYMGHKWQCVEFARRFLFLNYGMVFTDVGMAWEIFSLRFLREVVNDNILPLQAFPNGSPRAPVAGALLIWQKGGEFKDTGHVAVVTQLLENKIRIAEQNVLHTPLPPGQQWTRELEMVVENGHYTLRDTFDDTTILTAIKELKRGIYIAGTENSSIRILESHQKGSFKIRKTTDLNNSTFFQSNLIRNFFIDRSNCLWIGSGHNGVAIVDLSPLPFHKLLMPKEEIRPLVRVITKDSSDNLWIGIKLGGLYMLKDGVYTKFPIDSKQNFNAIMEDSKKNIWILTNKNVYIYKGKKLYNLNEISGIPTDIYNKILAASVIIEDDQGTIWIGGTGKLAQIRGLFTSSVSVHYFNAPYTQDIFCLGKDKLGRIWLGSRSKGIFVITLNIFSDIIKYQSINTTNSSIKSNHIWDICFSKNGNYVWVATDSGINSFDCSSLEANVISVAPHEKLINHKILSVIEVSDHSIWLNTSQGLLHYNPETGHYREYYYSDGLCSNCLTEAGYLAADGTLYIGSINGINYFNPLDIKDIRNDAQIQTIRFMIYNKSVKPNQKINSSVPLKCNIIDADQIDISYLNNNFSFEFIAPNYTSPNKIYYAYKLEGVDEDWVYTSSDNRIASYNNLDAGKYKFHVK